MTSLCRHCWKSYQNSRSQIQTKTQSVWPVSKLSIESVSSRRELVANLYTHRRRRRDRTVSSCRRRRCVLGITSYILQLPLHSLLNVNILDVHGFMDASYRRVFNWCLFGVEIFGRPHPYSAWILSGSPLHCTSVCWQRDGCSTTWRNLPQKWDLLPYSKTSL